MNKIFLIIIILLTSCNKDILNSNVDNLVYNPEISLFQNQNSIDVLIFNYPSINGFQFDLDISDNLTITSLNAFNGISEEYNFYIASSLNNLRVLGFSLTDSSIPSLYQDSSVLIELQLNFKGTGTIGLTNVILSGENGNEIPTTTLSEAITVP
tara:strand:+ start:2892 stop:3353 length:462 start_codon:yes stop_codon:yes gene_type:complete